MEKIYIRRRCENCGRLLQVAGKTEDYLYLVCDKCNKTERFKLKTNTRDDPITRTFVCPVCATVLIYNTKKTNQYLRCTNCNFKIRKFSSGETIIGDEKFDGAGLA